MPEESSDWTVLRVLGAALSDVRRHPIATLLLIGAIPSLWGGVFKWTWSRFAESPSPLSIDLDHVALAFIRRLAHLAWNSVLTGGQYLLALDIARGLAPRPMRLIHGLTRTVAIFLASGAVALALEPTEIAMSLRHTFPLAAGILEIGVSIPLTWVVLMRTAVCIPLVVDRNCSFPVALRSSWILTDRQSWKIARIYLILILFFLPLAFIHKTPFLERVVFAFGEAAATMTLAHLYLRLAGRRHDSAEAYPLATAELNRGLAIGSDDLPIRGSGWTKSVSTRTK